MKTEISPSGAFFLDVVFTRCEVTDRSTGETVASTVVNWSGLVASGAGCLAAWLIGATIGGTIGLRRGLIGATALLLIAAAALFAFFV